eukprot:432206-Hanusia_phi.AAC.1
MRFDEEVERGEMVRNVKQVDGQTGRRTDGQTGRHKGRENGTMKLMWQEAESWTRRTRRKLTEHRWREKGGGERRRDNLFGEVEMQEG